MPPAIPGLILFLILQQQVAVAHAAPVQVAHYAPAPIAVASYGGYSGHGGYGGYGLH